LPRQRTRKKKRKRLANKGEKKSTPGKVRRMP